MTGPHCESAATAERSDRTELGYHPQSHRNQPLTPAQRRDIHHARVAHLMELIAAASTSHHRSRIQTHLRGAKVDTTTWSAGALTLA